MKGRLVAAFFMYEWGRVNWDRTPRGDEHGEVVVRQRHGAAAPDPRRKAYRQTRGERRRIHEKAVPPLDGVCLRNGVVAQGASAQGAESGDDSDADGAGSSR